MKVLSEKTEKKPSVTFDGVELVIAGRSFMENAAEFYKNLIATVKSLQFEKLNVVVNLSYFNTSSSKCLLELFRALEKMNSKQRPIAIFWYYEAESLDNAEAGEDYRDLVSDIPFDLVIAPPEDE